MPSTATPQRTPLAGRACSVEWLREAELDSVNVALICGRPLQTPERFRTTLELVRELRASGSRLV